MSTSRQYTFAGLLMMKMCNELPSYEELQILINTGNGSSHEEYTKIPGEYSADKAIYLINTPYEEVLKDYCRIISK